MFLVKSRPILAKASKVQNILALTATPET